MILASAGATLSRYLREVWAMEKVRASSINPDAPIPWFGALKIAGELQEEVRRLEGQLTLARQQLDTVGVLSTIELQTLNAKLEQEIQAQRLVLVQEKVEAAALLDIANTHLEEIRQNIVATEEIVLLQEAGIYRYRHPLTDIVA
jgi:hypothetical protein